MKRLIVLFLVAGLSSGCVFARTDSATMLGVGKVSAEHGCAKGQEPDPAAETKNGCTKIEGQGFTEGFVKFLSDSLTVIPRMLAGAVAGAATTQ